MSGRDMGDTVRRRGGRIEGDGRIRAMRSKVGVKERINERKVT